MLHGVWQLAKLSLTLDARRVGVHLTRLGLLSVLYLAVIVSRWNVTVTAGGLWLFHAQLLITTFYISVNAVFGFSQTFADEKEDGSLGLMRMAGISGLSILLGKTASRLFDASLLIAIQFPFTLVAVTLGGVAMAQVTAAYVALIAYLWLLAAVGIAASVVCRNGSAAARVTALFLVMYSLPTVIPLSARWAWPLGVTVFDFYRWISLPMRLLEVTDLSFDGSAWSWQVAFGVVAGFVILSGTWLLFDRVALAEPVMMTSRPVARRLTRPRVWSHPLRWREFYFLTGGITGVTMRLVVHGLILIGTGLSTAHIGYALVWAALWSALLSLIDGTWTASRLFRDEIHEQTWSGLMLTPPSAGRLAWEKLRGWVLGMSPSIVFPYLYIVLTILFHPNVRELDRQLELIVGSMLTGVAVFAYLHLLVLLSLYLGRSAVPMTITVCFALGWLYVYLTYHGPNHVWSTIGWFVFSMFVFAGVMAMLQAFILRRLNDLAATA